MTLIREIFTLILVGCTALTACTNPATLQKPIYIPNKQFENVKYLAKEQSPYLLSFVRSNVNWYPWGDAAFKKASAENKMILVDFGSLSCDACFTKDQDVFENPAVAKFLNDNFVTIKVDINERPDIYKFYQQANKIHNNNFSTGSITALSLPDGKPFWLNHEFSKKTMSRTLNFFVKQYYRNPTKIKFVAEQLVKNVESQTTISVNEPSFEPNKLAFVGDKVARGIDLVTGRPKSDAPQAFAESLRFLLRHYYNTKNPKVLEAVEIALKQLAFSSSYDHMAGGFFESAFTNDPNALGKTIATNAQLVSVYAEAHQITQNPLYKTVIEGTTAFIDKELSHTLGGFFLGLQGKSADNPAYYLVTKTEAEKAIGNEHFAEIFCDYYNITDEPSLPRRTKTDNVFLKDYGLTFIELESLLYVCQQKLLKARKKKLHPKTDYQLVTANNAVTIRAFVDAYRALGHHTYLERAIRGANFLDNKLTHTDGKLKHSFINARTNEMGFLDDYAFTISAFTDLYQVTFDEKWLYMAKDLGKTVVNRFKNEEIGMFHYASKVTDASFLNGVHFVDIEDSYLPSGNAAVAHAMFVLGLYFEDDECANIAKTMMANVQKNIEKASSPSIYAHWGLLYNLFVVEPYEVTIVGSDYERLRKGMDKNFLPNVFMFGGNSGGTLPAVEGKFIEGETLIYVCKNKICRMPTDQVDDAIAQIEPVNLGN